MTMAENTAPTFAVDRAELAKAVAWINQQYGARYVLPILAAVVIDASEGTVTLSAYDFDVSATVSLDATVLVPGRVLVNRKMLGDMLKTSSGVTAELVTVDGKVTVSTGGARFTLPAMNGEDYPGLPAVPDTVATIHADTFAALTAQVSMSAGKDDTHPTLTGVFVVFEGHTVTMAATDSYRLGASEAPASVLGEASAIIPATVLAKAGKAFAKDGTVTVGITHDTASLTAGRRTITVRTIYGEYPRYRALLPTTSQSVAVLPVKALVAAVKRAKQSLRRGAPVVLSFNGDTLTVSATGDDGEGHEETLTVDYDGGPVAIGFNPDYLIAALSAVGTADALLNLNGPLKPGLFEPSEGCSGITQFKHILMPTRLAAR